MSNSPSPATQRLPIVMGARVVDINGARVGSAREYDALNQYLLVEHGWLEPLFIHVPLYAIMQSDTRRIELAVSKDDALNSRWPALAVDTSSDAGDSGAGTPTNEDAPAPEPPVAVPMPGSDAFTGETTPAAPPSLAVVTPMEGRENAGELRIPIVEERLVVDTRQGQTGAVRVHKDVVEEQQTVLVTLRREVVTIEHVRVTGIADASTVTTAMTPQDFVIPVMAEQAVVTKEARIVEEVRLHKQDVAEEQSISDTVRKTRVAVDGLPRSA